MKSLIGISCRSTPLPNRSTPFQGVFASYIEGIANAGGAVLLLPLQSADATEAALECCSALLIPGGEDFASPRLNQNSSAAERNSPDNPRDHVEANTLLTMLRRKKPVLGICRGAHILNAVLGGDLAPLSTLVTEKQAEAHANSFHPIRIEPESTLSALFTSVEHSVHSRHSIGIGRLAPPLRPSAWASDGTIEAIEHTALPLIGVMWHPEMQLHSAASRNLFNWLVHCAPRT